jgi:PqqD family protein of HPr-rel-A system
MKWQLTGGRAVRIRVWDEEAVVFNSLSGDTYLLGYTAACIVSLLQQSSAEDHDLVAELSRQAQADVTEEFSRQVESVLAELRTLNLIEEVV